MIKYKNDDYFMEDIVKDIVYLFIFQL